jgi:hypothetical protein
MVLLTAAVAHSARPDSLDHLYRVLGDLRDACGGPFYLNECDGRMDWPDRGIYFFFSPDSDLRHDPPEQWAVTRIGTVGVAETSTSTLWTRLRQHRGNCQGKYAGGGNHRGSIFRLHVGEALINRDARHEEFPHWGVPHKDGIDMETPDLRDEEHPLELDVSEYIRNLPMLVVDVPGDAGPNSDRAWLEANLIALVSQHRRRQPELRPSDSLTTESEAPTVWRTGLWNIDHTDSLFDPTAVSLLEDYVKNTTQIK